MTEAVDRALATQTVAMNHNRDFIMEKLTASTVNMDNIMERLYKEIWTDSETRMDKESHGNGKQLLTLNLHNLNLICLWPP